MDLQQDSGGCGSGDPVRPSGEGALPSGNLPELSEVERIQAAVANIPAVVLHPESDKFLLVHLSIGGFDFIRPGRFHPAIVADFDDELLAHGLSAETIVENLKILGGAMLFRSKSGAIEIAPFSENLGPCDGIRVAEILRANIPNTEVVLVPYKKAI